MFFCTSPLRDFALAHRLARASANPTDLPGPSRLRRGFETFYCFSTARNMCVFTLLLFEPAFCWRQRVLRRSRAELILCSRILLRLDIVLSPRPKNCDFRLAPPLDSRRYTRRSLRRRPACFDYVDVDAHRIILEAHSSPYT